MIGKLALAAAAGCGSMLIAIVAGLTGSVPIVPNAPGSSAAADMAVTAAMTMLGTPYRWGGDSPTGFDCSGLAQWAYAQAGVPLPRTAQQQYNRGPRRTAGMALQAGDLVFFGTGPTRVDHVGLYLGAGFMLDAPHTGASVRIDPLTGFTLAFVGATTPGSSGSPR